MLTRVGLYFGALQFFFALTWIAYVIYLPALAAQAGLPPRAVPWILMLDQLVFLVCDLAAGLAADRVGRVVGRLGRLAAGLTLLSCAAFVLLPIVAPQGSAAALLVLTVLWAITSSALRAPPLALLGRHVPRPVQPAMVALSMLGLGLANAAAPYLGLVLKGVDPRVPFILASSALALTTLGLVAAERALARTAAPAAPASPVPAQRLALPAFAVCALFGALAFQLHGFVNSAPLYLQHAPAQQLPWLAPLIWVGFNLGLWPAAAATRRYGPLRVMAVAGAAAALAALGAERAPALAALGALQVLAGLAWAGLLSAAFSGALALGQGGREGLFSGTLSSLLAGAALVRLSLLATGVAAPLAGWPALLWLVAAALAALLAARMAASTAQA
jgi:hypothetical protein